jgi:hypothetical protein
MRARDLAKRERVMTIIEANELQAAEDYYCTAHIRNHGDTAEAARNAHWLALRSSELGYRPARWLAAASYDCWQMVQGKPQKYGNYVDNGRGDRLWDIGPNTTDEERAAWDMRPWRSNFAKPGKQTDTRLPCLRLN